MASPKQIQLLPSPAQRLSGTQQEPVQTRLGQNATWCLVPVQGKRNEELNCSQALAC